MAFISSSTSTSQPSSRSQEERRRRPRDLPNLTAQLCDPDPTVRRWAVRDLSGWSEAVGPLLDALHHELDPAVRDALFAALLAAGGEAVVEGLLPLLRSDDAALRNGALELLQHLPDAVAPHMEALLHDPDPDVRIFALDILRDLPHPSAPRWIAAILQTEGHVNVVATAVDRCVEIGEPEMEDLLRQVQARFSEEPYVTFAVETAIRRIGGGAA